MIQELSVDLELFISGLTSNHSLLISLVCRHESLILSSLRPFLQLFLPHLPLSRPLVSGGIPQIDWKYWRCVAGGRRSLESMEPLSDSPPSECLPERASGRPRQPLPGLMVNGSLLPSLSVVKSGSGEVFIIVWFHSSAECSFQGNGTGGLHARICALLSGREQ